MNPKHPNVFSCVYSPNIPHLLRELNCSLALTTYQASQVVTFFPDPNDEDHLGQLPANFPQAMGLAVGERRLAVAAQHNIVVLANEPSLAQGYQDGAYKFDSFYLPRATYHTSPLEVHDLEWRKGGLWGVNTLFSCLCTFDNRYNFQPRWFPPFIKKVSPEDFCHLNGMTMENGAPKYVTMFSQSTEARGWRGNATQTGLLMDATTNEIVLQGLPMPHSPRLFNGKLYVLLSAKGEVVEVDVNTGKYTVIHRLNGFVRGLAQHGDYLFVGLSKLREHSKTFRELPIAQQELNAGIEVIHLPSGELVGHIHYTDTVSEVFDVKILPNTQFPCILDPMNPEHVRAINTKVLNFWLESPSTQEEEATSLTHT